MSTQWYITFDLNCLKHLCMFSHLQGLLILKTKTYWEFYSNSVKVFFRVKYFVYIFIENKNWLPVLYYYYVGLFSRKLFLFVCIFIENKNWLSVCMLQVAMIVSISRVITHPLYNWKCTSFVIYFISLQ